MTGPEVIQEVIQFVQSYGGSICQIAVAPLRVRGTTEIGQLEQINPILLVETRDIQLFIEAIFAAPFDLIRADGTLLSVESNGLVHWIENLATSDYWEKVANLKSSGQILRSFSGNGVPGSSRSPGIHLF